GTLRWVAVAVVIVAFGGFGLWRLTQPKEAVVTPSSDAAPIEAKGELDLDSRPPGARGTLTGPDGDGTKFGPTPLRVSSTSTAKVKIHMELAGYNPFEDEVAVEPGQVVRVAPTLVQARATLHVVTTPSQAQVLLAGKTVGDTPLTRDDLDVASQVELVIQK